MAQAELLLSQGRPKPQSARLLSDVTRRLGRPGGGGGDQQCMLERNFLRSSTNNPEPSRWQRISAQFLDEQNFLFNDKRAVYGCNGHPSPTRKMPCPDGHT